MLRLSKDKNINTLVNQLISVGWKYKRRKKHGSIISPKGKMLIIPSTPSDRRAFYNFRQDVKAISRGC